MRWDETKGGAMQLGELSTGAFSHQMREPLADIFASLPLLVKHSDETGEKYCDELQRSAYRMLRVVRNIEMAGELAAIDIEMEPVDLTAAVDAIRSAAAGCVREVPIGGASEGGPLVVRANLETLLHAILGVVRNALQYTRDGNRIHIDLARNGARAMMRITDRGLGIKPMHQPYIFDPYYSVDPYGDNPTAPGLGLGLSILYRAMQHFGGNVAVESVFGEGTTIVVSLPLRPTWEPARGCSATDLMLNRFSPLYVALVDAGIRHPEL